MDRFNTETKKFVSELKNNLICSKKDKQKISSEIENNITDYIENNNITDFSEVINHFGTPEKIAEQFAADIAPTKIKKASLIKKIIIAIAVIGLAALTIYLVTVIIDAHYDFRGYGVTYEVVETDDIITEADYL